MAELILHSDTAVFSTEVCYLKETYQCSVLFFWFTVYIPISQDDPYASCSKKWMSK